MDKRVGGAGPTGWAWRIRVAIALLLCLTLVSACFVPDHYEAEIRFTKVGAYGITFNGILTHAPLFSEIAKGTVSDADAQKQIKGFLAELKQDDSFKDVNSLGRGRFQVRYEHEGRFFGEHQMVTFVSRQAPIFRIRTFEDGRISVAGSGAGRQYADKLEEVGLNTQGLFRVVTDAEVIEHNAQFVRASATPGFTVYDWHIRGFRDPPPHLIARMVVDPKTGGPLTAKNTGKGGADDSDLDDLAAQALKKQQQQK